MNLDQLVADAYRNIMKADGDIRIGHEEDSDSDSNECEHDLPAKKARKTVPSKRKHITYKPSSNKSDMKEADAKAQYPWKFPPTKSDNQISPASLFKLFFTPELHTRTYVTYLH